MSTPAAQALSEAGNAGGTPAGGTPASGTPAAAAPNPNAFWNSWNLPDQKETREWVANKNYDNPFTLASSARNWEREAATLRAGKGYPTPGQDGKVDENARKAWNSLTGVPESADKYEIPLPANNPYPQFKTYMAEALHKAGVPAAMAPQLARGYEEAVTKLETELREQENQKSTLALKELENTWGQNYAERMQFANRGKEWLAKEAGGLNDTQLRVLESVLGTDKFLTAMWKIGAGNKEASFAGGDGGNKFVGGASEAQARLDQITADRSAGKITDAQMRELQKPGGELEQLTNRIVSGMATGAQH
jgi:hypothetical protein